MAHASAGVGRSYLEQRSALTKRLAEGHPFQSIQIIDDSTFDANVLSSLLRKVLGLEIHIGVARQMSALGQQWQAGLPDLVFLDDRLGPAGSANIHLPLLRRLGYAGPVVVVSGVMTRDRRREMARLGAVEAVHKDDLVSSRLIEVLLLLADRTGPPPAP